VTILPIVKLTAHILGATSGNPAQLEVRLISRNPQSKRDNDAWMRRGDPMKRTIIIKSLFVEVMRRIRHFGDFATVPLAGVIFIGLAGEDRLYLALAGLVAWTLLEYLVHRFIFHRYSSVGRRLHQLHHDHLNDPEAERSSLSTPLIALPIGVC
jgi:hypothetical protein